MDKKNNQNNMMEKWRTYMSSENDLKKKNSMKSSMFFGQKKYYLCSEEKLEEKCAAKMSWKIIFKNQIYSFLMCLWPLKALPSFPSRGTFASPMFSICISNIFVAFKQKQN